MAVMPRLPVLRSRARCRREEDWFSPPFRRRSLAGIGSFGPDAAVAVGALRSEASMSSSTAMPTKVKRA
jgi:hypothetical protein